MVPPGIEKTPDQAARISQSVDFGHLSDILPFFGVPHFLTLFFDDFHFVTFDDFHFFSFCTFSDFVTFGVFHFFHFYPFCVIGLNCNVMEWFLFIGGRMRIMCGGSPLITGFSFNSLRFVRLFDFHVGEIHRVDFICNTRSPLSEPVLLYYVLLFRNSCRGDSQGRVVNLYSRSPLYETGVFF